jgi:hypothetical protein
VVREENRVANNLAKTVSDSSTKPQCCGLLNLLVLVVDELALTCMPSVCIDLHLSRMELRYDTAQSFFTFSDAKVSARKGMCDEEMKPRIWFLQRPTGRRCLVKLS